MLYYQPGMQAVRTCDSVANVRHALSLLSVRENRTRDESLLLQATHWKLVEITLKIELIVPDFNKRAIWRAIVWGCEICWRVSGPCQEHAL